jgi:hypothetical protein
MKRRYSLNLIQNPLNANIKQANPPPKTNEKKETERGLKNDEPKIKGLKKLKWGQFRPPPPKQPQTIQYAKSIIRKTSLPQWKDVIPCSIHLLLHHELRKKGGCEGGGAGPPSWSWFWRSQRYCR